MAICDLLIKFYGDRPRGTHPAGRGGLNQRGVAKYSDFGHFQGYILETGARWAKLVLINNRKSHMSFRMVPKSVTLNDLEGNDMREQITGTEFSPELSASVVHGGWREGREGGREEGEKEGRRLSTPSFETWLQPCYLFSYEIGILWYLWYCFIASACKGKLSSWVKFVTAVTTFCVVSFLGW